MQVAILGDSHIPSRESHIPAPFKEEIRTADHVIHTGDFDSKGALADMQTIAPKLTAVHGNMDPKISLPSVTTAKLGGVEFVVTHGTGSPAGWDQRVADAVAEHAETDTAIGVAGHTHDLTDTTHEGTRLLNPGSVTGAPPATETTMLVATVGDGDIDVTVKRP